MLVSTIFDEKYDNFLDISAQYHAEKRNFISYPLSDTRSITPPPKQTSPR